MTIEEKARAYDEALKVLHKYDGAHIMFTQDLKEEIFPELKESEDERIRKAIIDIIKFQKEQQCHIDGAIYDEMVAWLEKQGEIGKVSYETVEKEKEDCVNDETNAPTEYVDVLPRLKSRDS